VHSKPHQRFDINEHQQMGFSSVISRAGQRLPEFDHRDAGLGKCM
jgi:hypothetical protein